MAERDGLISVQKNGKLLVKKKLIDYWCSSFVLLRWRWCSGLFFLV